MQWYWQLRLQQPAILWAHKWKSTRSCDNPTPCLCSHILTDMCPYISRHISRVQAKAGGWAATQSLVALLPSYSPPPPNAAWATALSDWLPVRRTPTDPPSVQRQILRRDTFLRKHRDTRRRKRQKEKKKKEQKEVVVVTCDKWEYLLHTGIYLFYYSSLSFNKTSLIKPFWQSFSFIGQIKLIVKYQLSKHKKLGCVSPFAWS